MRSALVVLLSIAVLHGSCTHEKLLPAATVSAAPRFCPRHHIALVTVHGYHLDKHIECALPTEKYFRLQKYYPCATTTFDSFERSSDYPDPALITYCPKCEAEMNRLLR